MPQIIDNGPGFGGQLGAALGGGLSSGLQLLAQHKLGQIIERSQKKKDSEAFQSAGFTPAESEFIASQPVNLRPLYISTLRQGNIPQGQFNVPQLQQEAITPQEQELVGLESVRNSLNPRNTMNASQRELQRLSGGRQGNIGSGLGLDSILNTADTTQTKAFQPTPKPQAVRSAEGNRSIAESLTAPAVAKKSNAEKNIELKRSHGVADEINKSYKAARDSDTRLQRMEKLVDSGKLNGPLFASLVKGIALPFGGGSIGLPQGWLNAESQEFDKLSTDFVRGVKDIFGSQISKGEVDLFLKTIPSLTNSDEGKKVLIRNIRTLGEGAKIKKEAMDQIRKANGGRYPDNLEEAIEEVAGPRLQALKDRFIAPISEAASDAQYKDLPEASSASGKKFRDKKTGDVVQSVDGKWVKVS